MKRSFSQGGEYFLPKQYLHLRPFGPISHILGGRWGYGLKNMLQSNGTPCLGLLAPEKKYSSV